MLVSTTCVNGLVRLPGFGKKEPAITFCSDGNNIVVGACKNSEFLIINADTGKINDKFDRGEAETGCELHAGIHADVFWSSGMDALVRYSVSAREATDYFVNDSDDMALWSFALNQDATKAAGLVRHARNANSYEVPHVLIWDLSADRLIFDEKCMLGGRIFISPDGQRFAAVNIDEKTKGVEIWDVSKRCKILTLRSSASICGLEIDEAFLRALTIDQDGFCLPIRSGPAGMMP